MRRVLENRPMYVFPLSRFILPETYRPIVSLAKLADYSLNITHISHVNVYLSSMNHFPHLNKVMYGIFGTSPPTRACVSVDLHPPNRVRLDVVAFSLLSSPQDRRALHVQSISYWAPANIGPYSQSVAVRILSSIHNILIQICSSTGKRAYVRFRTDRVATQ